jgi:hypothetical protein
MWDNNVGQCGIPADLIQRAHASGDSFNRQLFHFHLELLEIEK